MTRHSLCALNTPQGGRLEGRPLCRPNIRDATAPVPPCKEIRIASNPCNPRFFFQITENRERITRAEGRPSALVRGDDEDHCSNDNAKDPEEGVDAVMEGSSVGIGFGRHENEN